MVALVVSTLVVLAAVSALVVARRGFTTVDAGGQLRDNARFAVDIIQKITAQGGYQTFEHAIETRSSAISIAGATTPPPFIEGFNNAVMSATTAPFAATNNRDTATTLGCTTSTDTACANGSDVLVVRYQGSETFPGSGVTDGTMIDCNGVSQTTPPTSKADLLVNIFHVQRGVDGEPNLVCSSNANSAAGTFTTQPLVQGVETFQVLYGTDAVVANTAPGASNIPDSVPDQYLRADQLAVAGNAAATRENWSRVRSLRIGMVLRGPRNSAQESATPVMYPLGTTFVNAANDKGSQFAAQTDGRLRQAVTLTIYLHNTQGL
ncbi:Prepilin-type N-terminal cleavage/methylation domain-containing protein [Burkholderiales bacterium 8X]|nr:Prepilin-type N-terminal cleavage/methylation domain-containing protein [Burkholderiales bacterium 8X]